MNANATAVIAAPMLVIRGVFAGILMGLANLVPGISGGTMLLAAGVYPRFIRAIAEFTTFTFKRESLLIFGAIVAAAVVAILLLAGAVRDLVIDHRWIMYSLFIGLTLGGVPVVWKMIRRTTPTVWAGLIVGFISMAALALMQSAGTEGDPAQRAGFAFMFLAGIAAASAMILPGVSGGYLLLVLGVYVPILSGVDAFKLALKARDIAAMMEPAIGVVLPVGLGVVTGVVAVSHLLKWVLARYENATLGVLLGLLIGAVVGLWPFQQGRMPQVGDVIKGQTVTLESIAEIAAADYPVVFFAPSAGQVVAAVALILVGFTLTLLIARWGRDRNAPQTSNPNPSTQD